mmetsp:Transcript_28309/g.13107  ORF Transcript_28309/g.13107 Transcript_28309/m.13107 type:complete len:144 (+) Transcript_28309:220-651(+)
MAHGWTIRYRELPDVDTLIPIGMLVFMLHLVVVGLGRITDDSAYKYSDYEGIAGYVLIGMRLVLFVWFCVASYKTYTFLKAQTKVFMSSFVMACSIYLLSMPVLVCITSFVAPYARHKVSVSANIFIQTIALLTLSFIFSRKS